MAQDGELLTPAVEDEFYKIIPLIAAKDKRIYDPKTEFFKESEEKPSEPKEKKKVCGPRFHARRLTRGGAEGEGSAPQRLPAGAAARQGPGEGRRVGRRRATARPVSRAWLTGPQDAPPPPLKSVADEERELKEAFWKSVKEMDEGPDVDDEDNANSELCLETS